MFCIVSLQYNTLARYNIVIEYNTLVKCNTVVEDDTAVKYNAIGKVLITVIFNPDIHQ